jgi:hypothetical protein
MTNKVREMEGIQTPLKVVKQKSILAVVLDTELIKTAHIRRDRTYASPNIT